MAALRRILRLWGIAAYMDAVFILRGFRQASIFMVSDMVIGLSAVTATFLLAERFDGIGVWTKDQVLFMLGYALVSRGAIDMCFTFNVAWVSRRIGRGQLDHNLVQPIPLWMGLLTEGFAPLSGSWKVIPGVLLLIWAMVKLGLALTPGWLAFFLLNLAGSVAVIVAFNYLTGTVAFWAPRGAEEINSSTSRMTDQLKQFPLDGLGGAALAGLMTVVPVGFVAWYPSRALLGLDPLPFAGLVTPLAALALWLVTAWVFGKGLQHYGRTGSSRYLSWGFRR